MESVSISPEFFWHAARAGNEKKYLVIIPKSKTSAKGMMSLSRHGARLQFYSLGKFEQLLYLLIDVCYALKESVKMGLGLSEDCSNA